MNDSTSAHKKPPLPWIEGMLDYFKAPFPYEKEDPRHIGFAVGQQIVGLYMVEMLLKYALDEHGIEHKNNHNLLALFGVLPIQDRKKVEKNYRKRLNNTTPETWDVAKTARSLLGYYGKSAITDTRYFWEGSPRTVPRKHASILINPSLLEPLIYSIFTALHGYPSEPLTKNFKTKFIPLRDNDP